MADDDATSAQAEARRAQLAKVLADLEAEHERLLQRTREEAERLEALELKRARRLPRAERAAEEARLAARRAERLEAEAEPGSPGPAAGPGGSAAEGARAATAGLDESRRAELEAAMARLEDRQRRLNELRAKLGAESASLAEDLSTDLARRSERERERQMNARMLTYRLMPVWIFLAVFGFLLVWEVGVQGNPITTGKLQAAALLSLFFSLIIGAVVGIRFFNPQPPKA